MKIAVVGGHMAPALGFIEALPKTVHVMYIGREHVFEGDTGTSLEQKTVEERKIPFIPFQSGRVQRAVTRQTLPSLLKIPKGFFQALEILKKEKPDVVVGFGGYLSVPIGFAAKMLGIPLVIHESTQAIGLANKVLSPFADKTCISWESSRPFFPKDKTVITGDPLLPFTSKSTKIPLPDSKEKLPLIVVTGGSGGSHAINMVILQILPELLQVARVLHQTGDAKEFGDYGKLLQKRKSLSVKMQSRYSVVKFIHPDHINTLFAKADLVIGRSGINTVVTLLVLQKKAILIPLLVGQKNEQLKNAQLMESEGLALILNQKTISPKVFFQSIQSMLSDKKRINKKWHIPFIENGAENLTREVLQCAKLSHKE